MKTTKIIIIATIITIMLICSVAYAMPAHAEDYGEFYPRLTVVVEVEGNTVICRDREGNLWEFFSDEHDWTCGDICNLLMWNVSDDATEHEIVEVYWEGYTENIDMFFLFNNWAH